jgi:hypothetical protein
VALDVVVDLVAELDSGRIARVDLFAATENRIAKPLSSNCSSRISASCALGWDGIQPS